LAYNKKNRCFFTVVQLDLKRSEISRKAFGLSRTEIRQEPAQNFYVIQHLCISHRVIEGQGATLIPKREYQLIRTLNQTLGTNGFHYGIVRHILTNEAVLLVIKNPTTINRIHIEMQCHSADITAIMQTMKA
jgi:hypothetical protein